QAIVRGGLGRRGNFLSPAQSRIFLKSTLGGSHKGGPPPEQASPGYQVLRGWLATAAPAAGGGSPRALSPAVFPSRRGASVRGAPVTYRDGKSRDVTAWAKFDSMDEGVLRVTPQGLVSAVGRGQGVAMARFDGQAAICTIVVPYARTPELARWTNNNFIDELAAAKFKEIGIRPSKLCDDSTFLRRAYLDAIGTLPTVDESTSFLDSKDPDKRKKLIDKLLGLSGEAAQDIHNNDYAAFWTLKWSDLIRSSSDSIGEQGMWALYNWIKESFRENRPFDQFVRELITAKGSTFSNGPANFY